jgi:cytochrome c biogenesis protein ResB
MSYPTKYFVNININHCLFFHGLHFYSRFNITGFGEKHMQVQVTKTDKLKNKWVNNNMVDCIKHVE